MNKSKIIIYSIFIIGIIALAGSFNTIYTNLVSHVGSYFASIIPICIDIFVIISTVYSMLMIEMGKIRQAKIVNYLSYIFMSGSLYFNIFNSLNDIPALIGHMSIVVVWITSVEMLTSYYKTRYKLNQKSLEKINELKEKEHQYKLDLLEIEHNKKKQKILDNTFEVEHNKKVIELRHKNQIKELEKLLNINSNSENDSLNKNRGKRKKLDNSYIENRDNTLLN